MAESIYESLGVRTVIDAWGTVTALGGSLMAPEVLQAMQSAAGAFVDMSELHTAAGRRIADLLGVEACCVTCGAAAGLAIAAAACMTGTRRSYAYQLPDTTGMKDEILCLKCHRDLYDQGMLLSGAHFVEIGVTSSAFLQQIGGPHQHSFHTWHQLDVENGERRFYKGACRADPQHDEAVRQISL